MTILRNVGAAGWCIGLVSACIGTDFQDDPTVDPVIELETGQVGLQIGEELQLFSNNLEHLLLSLEIGWFFPNNFGISAYAKHVLRGQNVLNAPGFGVGIFYQLKNTLKQPIP